MKAGCRSTVDNPFFMLGIFAFFKQSFFICCRNHIFQAFYVFLVATGHGILLLDALPFLHKLDPGTDHFRLPVGLLAVNVILFVISSYSDPGRITDKNVDQYLNTFLYDGVLYKEKQRCSTCLSYKPARSKHCGKFWLNMAMIREDSID